MKCTRCGGSTEMIVYAAEIPGYICIPCAQIRENRETERVERAKWWRMFAHHREE